MRQVPLVYLEGLGVGRVCVVLLTVETQTEAKHAWIDKLLRLSKKSRSLRRMKRIHSNHLLLVRPRVKCGGISAVCDIWGSP